MIKDNFRSLSPKIFLITFNTINKKIFSDLGFKNYYYCFFSTSFIKNVKSN